MSMGNYVKQAIATLALAGALSGGVMDRAYAEPKMIQQEQSEYSRYIQSYVNSLKRNYGDLLPKNRSFSFAYGSASDSQLFAETMDLYNSVMANYMKAGMPREEKQGSGNYNFHLVPFHGYDGSTYYTDVNGHGQLKIIRSRHGPILIGPGKLFEMIGGRALGDKLIDRVEDGEFFYNRR